MNCRNCGSQNLQWTVAIQNPGGVQDGRLCLGELMPIFVLGCAACSETIRIIPTDSPDGMLMLAAIPRP